MASDPAGNRAPVARFSRRHALALFAAGALGSGTVAGTDSTEASIPLFDALDAAGQRWRPADLDGAPTVLEWTSPACEISASRYALGIVPQLQTRYALHGVRWLTVLSTAAGARGHLCAEEALRWVSSYGAVPRAVIMDADGTVGHAFAATSTPFVAIVAPGRGIVYRGALDTARSTRFDIVSGAGNENHVRQTLDYLLRGERPVVSYVAPFGCAIPYRRGPYRADALCERREPAVARTGG